MLTTSTSATPTKSDEDEDKLATGETEDIQPIPEGAEEPVEKDEGPDVEVEKEAASKGEKQQEDKKEEKEEEAEETEEKETPVAPRRSGRASIPLRPTRGSLAAAKKEEGQKQEEEAAEEDKKKSLPPPNFLPAGKRSKKASERSEEPEEDAAPTTRSRRSATRKEEDGETTTGTPPVAVENRRLNRLRDLAEAGGGKVEGRGRRGSGATSRSSSPTGSERGQDSESESGVRTTRSRKRSGKPTSGTTAAEVTSVEESAPNSPASSVGGAESAVVGGAAGASMTSEDNLDPKTWKKQAFQLCSDIRNLQHGNVFMQTVNAAEALRKWTGLFCSRSRARNQTFVYVLLFFQPDIRNPLSVP